MARDRVSGPGRVLHISVFFALVWCVVVARLLPIVALTVGSPACVGSVSGVLAASACPEPQAAQRKQVQRRQ